MRTTALITGIAGGVMAIAVGTIGLVVVVTGLADLDQPVRAIALGLAAATIAVGLAALAGVVLAARGSAVAAPLLGLTAVAGFVTALPFWLLPGLLLGLATVCAARSRTTVSSG
jgi:hypothetical protein